MKLNKLQSSLIKKFYKDHQHKAYFCNIFRHEGLKKLYVGEGILRPDKSWVSFYLTRFLKRNPCLYKGKVVLDMGCGSGIQGLMASLNGAKIVISVDIEPAAAETTRKNIELHNLNKKMRVIQSDLFENVPRKGKIDVIIFNHPFFYQNPKNNIDRIIFSGDDLLDRFFRQINIRGLSKKLIIMPFSQFAPKHNNPGRYALKLGYYFRELEIQDKTGAHSIFLLSKDPRKLKDFKLQGRFT